MKRIICYISFVCLLTAAVMAQEPPSGEDILKRVDANIGSDNKISVAEMTIHGRRGSRTIKSRSWLQGQDKSFT
ncbi:MAG: outer membrane lipoprotein-sorting protein, partial [Candidatus Aminicenantes bacterium]|nr:outer membrane lipoprotein-sorting protein [Candidatus Aminicenantes bacterium]